MKIKKTKPFWLAGFRPRKPASNGSAADHLKNQFTKTFAECKYHLVLIISINNFRSRGKRCNIRSFPSLAAVYV